MDCLGKETDVKKDVEVSKIYVQNNRHILHQNKYGKLPTLISNILDSKCETGYMENKSCFLRAGINNNYHSSFLNVIMYYTGSSNIKQLRNQIVSKLTPLLFKSLNDGELEYKFYNKDGDKNSYENFKKYLLESPVIHYEYLWDLLQRENILFTNGINIVIFEQTELLCPLNSDINYFYDNMKNTIILNKIENFFEPIIYVKVYDYILMEKEFNSNIQQIQYIFDIIKNNCKEKYNINWNEYLLSINNKAFTSELHNKSLNELLKIFKPKTQVLDGINKVIYIQLDDNSLIPTKPSQLNIKLPYIFFFGNNQNKLTLNDYSKTYKSLNEISKKYNLPYKPIYKILDKKDQIIAIMIETGTIIPINVLPNAKSSLPTMPINYYSDADLALLNQFQFSDERINIIQKFNFENESYERLRFEFSKLINSEKNIKDLSLLIDNKNSLNEKED